jgi:polysaccharide biosynthesis protein PslG
VSWKLSNLLNGVPLSMWYDSKNDGHSSNENEHDFGTLISNLAPKPAEVAIQTLTRELSGHHVVRRLALPGEKECVRLCRNPAGGQKLAACTLGDPHPIGLKISLSRASQSQRL